MIDTANIIEGKRGTKNNHNNVTPERIATASRLRDGEKEIHMRIFLLHYQDQ
jgi:hypothetical protein